MTTTPTTEESKLTELEMVDGAVKLLIKLLCIQPNSEKSTKRILAGNCFKTRSQANSFRAMMDDVISGVAIPARKPWWRFW